MTDATKAFLDSLFRDVTGWHDDTWKEWSKKHPINYTIQYDLHCPPHWVPVSECWYFWENPHPNTGLMLDLEWNIARDFYWQLYVEYAHALEAQGRVPPWAPHPSDSSWDDCDVSREPQVNSSPSVTVPKPESNPVSKSGLSRSPAVTSAQSVSPSSPTAVLIDPAKARLKLELEDARLKLRLQKLDWTDERLALIPEESLASMAFDLSPQLQSEFGNKGIFLSFWRALRSRQVR